MIDTVCSSGQDLQVTTPKWNNLPFHMCGKGAGQYHQFAPVIPYTNTPLKQNKYVELCSLKGLQKVLPLPTCYVLLTPTVAGTSRDPTGLKM